MQAIERWKRGNFIPFFEAPQAQGVRTVGQHNFSVHLEANPALDLPLQIQLREIAIPSLELVHAQPPLLPVVQLSDPAWQLKQRREYNTCRNANTIDEYVESSMVLLGLRGNNN